MTGNTCRMYHFCTNVMLMEHSGETRSMLNVDAAVAASVTLIALGHENANALNIEIVCRKSTPTLMPVCGVCQAQYVESDTHAYEAAQVKLIHQCR